MKKLIILIVLAFVIQAIVLSQSCLPEGITFTTQQQIDNFQTNYPGCKEIEGSVLINGSDISNLNGLLGLESIEGFLEIDEPYSLYELSGLDSLKYIGGNFWIFENDNLTNLVGLNSLNTVEGNFTISYSYSLINFSGLEALTTIGNSCYIEYNSALKSLDGLNNLNSLDGSLTILQNSELESITSLNNLENIGGSLFIVYNNSISNLYGLDELSSIGGSLGIQHNTSLINLSGLDNINLGSISELHIVDNNSLSTCDVQSICDYLISPTGFVEICNNAPGCNSIEEVEEACLTSTEDISAIENNITIFPNPAKKTIAILSYSEIKIKEVNIYNPTGQVILQKKTPDNTIDISSIQPGLYFIEIVTDIGNVRKKLIIQ